VDMSELEAAYAGLLEAAGRDILAMSSGAEWGTSTVLAHVIASSRMLAAASAECERSRY